MVFELDLIQSMFQLKVNPFLAKLKAGIVCASLLQCMALWNLQVSFEKLKHVPQDVATE